MATKNDDGTYTITEEEARGVVDLKEGLANTKKAGPKIPNGHLTPEQAAQMTATEYREFLHRLGWVAY